MRLVWELAVFHLKLVTEGIRDISLSRFPSSRSSPAYWLVATSRISISAGFSVLVADPISGSMCSACAIAVLRRRDRKAAGRVVAGADATLGRFEHTPDT